MVGLLLINDNILVKKAIENFKTIIKIRMSKSKKDTRATILFEFKKSFTPLPLPAVTVGDHADEF
jgi:hypothetical protein